MRRPAKKPFFPLGSSSLATQIGIRVICFRMNEGRTCRKSRGMYMLETLRFKEEGSARKHDDDKGDEGDDGNANKMPQ